jgi:Fur family transcriptional regulator, ferric uptake regulator
MSSESAPRKPKTTRQGRAVLSAARSSQRFRSAQEIYADLQAEGEAVGLTTVYRHLESLAAAGVLDTLRTDSGEVTYRCCRIDDHHHHIVCRNCGSTSEIEADDLESWVEKTAEAHGYADESHTFEIYGLCSRCQTKTHGSRGAREGPTTK